MGLALNHHARNTMILSRTERRNLQNILDEVACAVHDGHMAWQYGKWSIHNIRALSDAHRKMVRQLAQFQDRTYLECEETLCAMRTYEQLATDLLDGIAKLGGTQDDELIRTPSGAYAVSRQLVLAGRQYQNAVVCNNPAYAALQLDEWEQHVRLTHNLGAAA